MTAPTEDLIELLLGRIGQNFDGEAHLTEVEARSIAQALRSLQAEVERLRGVLVDADLTIRSLPGTDQSHVEFIRSALNTGSGEG